jgi:ATP phosphoribosyltransferase regulatory subunit
MADTEERALLPAGMADWLPPAAEHEAWAVETLIGVFRAWGYERVKPPLMEFEDSLLAGPGRAVADNTFRLMDPVSQRMMGLRADVTVQVARIATARLGAWPRPLRLAYAGQVMRVRGSQLRPTRQFGQVGAELIGPDTPDADAEAIVLAARAVRRLGVSDLSVDLGLPTLVPAICRGARVDDDTARRLRDALDRKDAAAVAALEPQLGEAVCALMAGLLNAVGAAESALAQLTDLDLSGEAALERDRLADVVARVRAAEPALPLTLDPVERRGLEYHTGVTFAVFAKNARGELGRGGRYRAGGETGGGPDGEPATGLSFYMDTVLQVAPAPAERTRIFAPPGSDAATVEALRAEGWVVVAGVEPCGDANAAAAALDCREWLDGSKRRSVERTNDGKGRN